MATSMPTVAQRMLASIDQFVKLNDKLSTDEHERMALSNALSQMGDSAPDNETRDFLYEVSSFTTLRIEQE